MWAGQPIMRLSPEDKEEMKLTVFGGVMHSTTEANNALISIILLHFYLKHIMQPLGNVIVIHSPVGVNTTFQVVR